MITKLILSLLALITAPFVDNDIERAAKSIKNGWISYQVPAAPETPSVCCWDGDDMAQCDLNQKHRGYGSRAETPKTDQIHVYVKIKASAPEVIMPVGDHCEVKTGGVDVKRLGPVAPKASVNWLKAQAISRQGHADENGSLYALSLHGAPEVPGTLVELAELNREGLSSQAVFWLGNRQGNATQALKKLLGSLPKGETRRSINMALQHQASPAAFDLLKQVAQDDKDPEQQRDAIFWLGQSDQIEAQALLDMIADPEMSALHEALVFSLSQSQQGEQALFRILKGDYSQTAKKQAVFWLAQSDDETTQNQLMEML